MENALTRNNNQVDAVVASNDGTAGGAIQALEEQKLAGKVRDDHPELLRTYVVVSPEAVMPAALDLPVIRDEANAFRVAYGVRGPSAWLRSRRASRSTRCPASRCR